MSQMSTEERLVYMANQIATNLAAAGSDGAAAATADHIASFWDPRMRQRILAHLDVGADSTVELSPIARSAVELLASRGAPAPQTQATMFSKADDIGVSDAG